MNQEEKRPRTKRIKGQEQAVAAQPPTEVSSPLVPMLFVLLPLALLVIYGVMSR